MGRSLVSLVYICDGQVDGRLLYLVALRGLAEYTHNVTKMYSGEGTAVGSVDRVRYR